AVAIAARLAPGDPLRGAVRERAAAVERAGDLQPHPGPAALHARQKADVELARFALHQAVLEADARSGEGVAAARRLRVGITQRRDHASHFRVDQRAGAGRRAAIVAARL